LTTAQTSLKRSVAGAAMQKCDSTKLDVPLRGHRDYLQGGDICRSVTDHLASVFGSGPTTNFRLKFNNLSRTQLSLSYWPAGERTIPKRTNGLLWFSLSDGREFEGYLCESGAAIRHRIEGFESAIVSATDIADDTACTTPVEQADLIEHVVFATKLLHNKHLPLSEGRWIVVEFLLSRLLPRETWGPVQINLDNSHAGRVTQSRVSVGAERVGDIRFLTLTQ